MKKLMIAVESELLRQTLTEQLEGSFEILTASDGKEALLCLSEWDPDILVIDLSLRHLDGVGVLRNGRMLGRNPQVIALTVYISDYVIHSLAELEVSHVLCLPCDVKALVARIMDVAAEQSAAGDGMLCDLLAVLGFNLSTVGCRIVQQAVLVYCTDPTMALTTQLYPAVAQRIGGTAVQVERAIRSSIEAAWKHRDEAIWRLYWPAGRCGRVERPTNAAFLSRLVQCVIRMEKTAYSDRQIV